MTHLPFSRLLEAQAPSVVEILGMYCGRTLDEVSDWPIRPDIMLDGLSRSLCHDAFLSRAVDILGEPVLAMSVAELLSTLAPLANDVAEIDAAIDTAARWLVRLRTDHLFERIVDAKRDARADRLKELDGEALDTSDRALLDERLEELEDLEQDGTLVVSLGGLDLMFLVEETCIMTLGQTTPGSEEFLVLYSFDHVVDDGDDDSSGGYDDGPDMGPTPDTPTLLAA